MDRGLVEFSFKVKDFEQEVELAYAAIKGFTYLHAVDLLLFLSCWLVSSIHKVISFSNRESYNLDRPYIGNENLRLDPSFRCLLQYKINHEIIPVLGYLLGTSSALVFSGFRSCYEALSHQSSTDFLCSHPGGRD